MKYLFEYGEWFWDGASDDNYDVEVGDILYCINNKGVSQELEIGKGYEVDMVWKERQQIFRFTDGYRWLKYRFSKDPNHISISQYNAKRFNL